MASSDALAWVEERIAECEASAAHGGQWVAIDDTDDPDIQSWWVFNGKGNVTFEPFEDDAKFIARHDPTTMCLIWAVIAAAERRRQAKLAFTREWDAASSADDLVALQRLWEGLEQSSNILDVKLLSLWAHVLGGDR